MAYTNIDDPSAYFHTLLWTGNGADNRALTNDANAGNFKPDFVWVKGRNQAEWHNVYDSSRGANKSLYPNSTYQEESLSETFESFDTNGFTVSYNSAYSSVFTNKNSTTYVAWQWKANGGTTVSNTDGSITSTVQANTDAGFSIMTYSGTTGDVHTIGHGLGVTPDVWIVKQKSGNSEFKDWFFWHKDMAASNVVDNRMLFLNTNAAVGTYTGINAVTSSTIRVKSSTTAQNGDTYVAYCFAEKQGYSKFGSYVGNGNDNGPFVYTGFKPAFLIMKRTDSTGNWVMFDTKRDTYNVTKHRLFPNLSNSDNTTRNYIDLLSNGFKMRNTDVDHNASGATIIYMAFAENPFTTSKGVPTTAR